MACLVTIEEPGLQPSLHVVLVLFLLFVVASVCDVLPFRVLCVRQGQVPVVWEFKCFLSQQIYHHQEVTA